MEDITKLFCLVDDFCRDIEKNFAGKLLPNGKKPTRTTEIEHSEIMTIILLYQQSPCKNFKTFYLHYLTLLYKSEFPKLPSYTRFVALKPRVLWHLAMLLHWLCGQSENTGISYIDTTPIAVCHAKRISKNKVFAGIAKLSKSTYGWFFGFKLHMVINENGEIHALTLTKGNVDDRIPVPNLTEKLTGLLFGDKGYIAKELFQKLFDRGLKLVTKVKKGMKNTLISLNEKILLRKRSIIETVFGYLKNRLEIEHTRHRSPVDFLVHIFSTLISYSIKSKKPSISYTSFLNPEFAFMGRWDDTLLVCIIAKVTYDNLKNDTFVIPLLVSGIYTANESRYDVLLGSVICKLWPFFIIFISGSCIINRYFRANSANSFFYRFSLFIVLTQKIHGQPNSYTSNKNRCYHYT